MGILMKNTVDAADIESYAETGNTISAFNVITHEGHVMQGEVLDGQIPTVGQFVEKGLSSLNAYIRWQNGPMRRDGRTKANGAFVEDILEACKMRLEAYQKGPFAHDANASAIMKIEEAITALVDRREDRKARGVLGTNEL